ncbi:hypothetical protein [Lewinella sp. LCG006]|uniref:hypothetical protein n=1 Tax=Lewinella sp. LCG006 TaxID=3231911 RepID=UPI0034615AA6
MKVIKGKIRRKSPLSLLELRMKGLQKEADREVYIDVSEITSFSIRNNEETVIETKDKVFENREDFELIVSTFELLKTKSIMGSIIDQLLDEMNQKGSMAVSKDIASEKLIALRKMEAIELVSKEKNMYVLTRKGYEVIEFGSFTEWKSEQESQKIRSSTYFVGSGSTLNIGDNNQINSAYGVNIQQGEYPDDYIRRITEFIEIINKEMPKDDFDGKEDMLVEIQRLMLQLKKSEPKKSIISQSLETIHGILLGVAGNAWTEPVLASLQSLFG